MCVCAEVCVVLIISCRFFSLRVCGFEIAICDEAFFSLFLPFSVVETSSGRGSNKHENSNTFYVGLSITRFWGFDLTVEFVFPTSTTSTMVRVGRHASQCLFVFVSAAASEFDFNTRGVV